MRAFVEDTAGTGGGGGRRRGRISAATADGGRRESSWRRSGERRAGGRAPPRGVARRARACMWTRGSWSPARLVPSRGRESVCVPGMSTGVWPVAVWVPSSAWPRQSLATILIPFAVSRPLWKERNARVFRGAELTPSQLLMAIKQEGDNWIAAGDEHLGRLFRE
uniref:Uncharacterized protein n=1 Tax=Setaria viridis TaxID=4556 RepID=A0A4U6UUF4_SETVI|nr:hypothetical protein SEVIR_5G420400v2 [Setaria viridis]